jgi:hypothetical protein
MIKMIELNGVQITQEELILIYHNYPGFHGYLKQAIPNIGDIVNNNSILQELKDTIYDMCKSYNYGSTVEIMYSISDSLIESIKTCNDKHKYALIKESLEKNPCLLSKMLENFKDIIDDEIILMVLERYGWEIKCVENPTEEMKLMAAKHNGFERIKDPTEDMVKLALNSSGKLRRNIIVGMMKDKILSQDLQKFIVQKNGMYIKYLNYEGLTHEVVLAAIKSNWKCIYYLQNKKYELSEECQMAVVKAMAVPELRPIKNPSKNVILYCIKHNGLNISDPNAKEYILSLNDKEKNQLIMDAIMQDPFSIKYITNPNPKMQILAVKRNKGTACFIKNPSPELIKYMIKSVSKK